MQSLRHNFARFSLHQLLPHLSRVWPCSRVKLRAGCQLCKEPCSECKLEMLCRPWTHFIIIYIHCHIIISYIYIYTYIHIFTFLADLNNLLGLHRALSTPLWFLGDSWCAVRFAQVVYLDEDVVVKGDLLELFHVSMSRSIGGLVMFIGSLTSYG